MKTWTRRLYDEGHRDGYARGIRLRRIAWAFGFSVGAATVVLFERFL